MENWKVIKGQEGRYEVSDLGNIRSISRSKPKSIIGKTLKPSLSKAGKRFGYYQITFGNRSRFYVHRLVAQAFIPNPNNLLCINHKDGNGLNNHVSNLEWCSYSENKLHSLNVLKCKKAHEVQVINIETGVCFSSKTEAYKSKPQQYQFSQFAAMLAGKWKNKTEFLIL